MKTARLIPFIILPLLFACAPRKPEIPMTEAPAGPLVQALEQRGRTFSTLKAIASIRVARKDRKRSFESVGILVKDQERFRIEAYTPLGQNVVTVMWDGRVVMIDLEGERRFLEPGSGALERVLGADVDPAELCAILSGNIPGILAGSQAKLLCAANGRCVLELRREDRTVRAYPEAGREPGEPAVRSYDVYHGGHPVYHVEFESFRRISGYPLPMKIAVENRDKRMSLTVEYAEAELNVPLDVRAFTMPAEEGLDR